MIPMLLQDLVGAAYLPPWWDQFWVGCATGCLLALAAGYIALRLRPHSLAPAVPPEPATASISETVTCGPVVEMTEATRERPGALIVRLQELCTEFELATQDVQRYSGTSEALIQGWQQLCSDIIRRVLPVLENLEPYLEEADAPGADIAQMAYGRLITELVTIGVTQIMPARGDAFNVKLHLAAGGSHGLPPYRISQVITPGYLFRPRVQGAGEIVLKPAEVVLESADITIAPMAESLPQTAASIADEA